MQRVRESVVKMASLDEVNYYAVNANRVKSLRKPHISYKPKLPSPKCAVKYQGEPYLIQRWLSSGL
jgi:hypothetical protein